jgi:hypothetical protein
LWQCPSEALAKEEKGGENMKEVRKDMLQRFDTVRRNVEKHFPIKPKTFDEFIAVLEKEHVTDVSAEVLTFQDTVDRVTISAMSDPVTPVGVGYKNHMRATTSRGRPVVYNEYYGYVPFYDFKTENGQAVELAAELTVHKRLESVQSLLPDTAVVFSKDDEAFDETRRKRLAELDQFKQIALRPMYRYSSPFHKNKNVIEYTSAMRSALRRSKQT